MSLATTFRYTPSPARLYAGKDALRQLPAEVDRAGGKRALIVCGRSVAERTTLLDDLRGLLGERCAGVFSGVQAESPLPSVMAAVAAARGAEADLIIALGGGSTVVTARAATILLAERGTAHELCTQYPPGRPPVSPRLIRPKLPNIVVLTTPTTAANRAGAAVMDPERRHRLELFDPKTRPAAVFLDEAALLSAPLDLCLSTATTTFCGLAGALQASAINPFAHADLRQALSLSLTYMPRLRQDPADGETRVQLATAALLANRAIDASGGGGGGGVGTGIGHVLQVRYDGIDQGAAQAVLTPPAMRFNRAALAAGQARLAEALGARRDGMSEDEAAEAAAGAVATFLGALGLPRRLRELNVPEADLDAIAAEAMTDFFLRNNARPVQDAAELLGVLREAW